MTTDKSNVSLPAENVIEFSARSPTLVVIPGVANPKEAYLALAEELTETCRVVLIDLPGHGDHKDQPFSFDAAVDTVRTVLEQEDQPYLLGHSLGGYTAMEVAGTYPRSVEGLLITGSTLNYSRLSGYRYCTQSLLFDALFSIAETVGFEAYEWLTKKTLEDMDVQSIEGSLLERVEIPTIAPDTISRVQKSLWGRDSFAPMENYDGHVLVVNGAKDGYHRHVDEFMEIAPQTEIHAIDEAGHNAVHTHPSQMAEKVRLLLEA